MSSAISILEQWVFCNRKLVIGLFVVITVLMLVSASRLHIDAGFDKLLPLKHNYMKVFAQYRGDFGGANRVIVALVTRKGDIFTPEFFTSLEAATNDVFFMPGVDRSRVSSLFTPNVTYSEVVEDGFVGGNVVPSDFTPTAEKLAQVRKNVLASQYMGRLVANDFTGAIISAELMEVDPNTGKKLDVMLVAKALEKIRDTYSNGPIEVHIIGYAKMIGDMAEGASRVVLFFGITFVITAIMVLVFTSSTRRTALLLGCSLIAVIWQLGLLPLLGYGIDPMGILVPFLIFAIAVSHGVQMATANRAEVLAGAKPLDAAKRSFRRLLVPGIIALASDTIGFITIRFIEIRIIQEMAVTAGLGVMVIILTNLLLLPVLLSYIGIQPKTEKRLRVRMGRFKKIWGPLSEIAERRNAGIIIAISLGLFAVGFWKGMDIRIGDLQHGVPELRPDSRYNVDTRIITEKFSIGTDVISVYAEAGPDACIDCSAMRDIDDFSWHVANVKGVHSSMGLPAVAKILTSGWNQGSLEWRVLSRNRDVLREAVQYVPTTSGLLNRDCSVMPIYIFTRDHKAETISNVIAAVKEYDEKMSGKAVSFKLAGGNVGVMAATNEEVIASQFPILFYVFAAVIVLCLVTYRSVRATICIVLPLGLVSLLGYALMSFLEIGLKVNTLPVVALGVGVGVDYGIYIFSRLESILKEGKSMKEAYAETLSVTGNGVMITGVTLALGVGTWIFSPLQFQADMGILLTFLFLVNMLGAVLLLPALAAWLLPAKSENGELSIEKNNAGKVNAVA
jgi:predicted RND superfamily exporter protein